MERRDLAEGVTIEEYSPKKLKLRLEEVSQKEIQVIPRVVGSPPEGYERGKVRVKPEFVTIRGAQSLLADISQVYLSAINIDGRKKSVRQRAKLLLKDAIHSQIKSAYVYIPIVKSSAIQTYEIPIVVEGVVDLDTRLGYRLSHKTTTVRLRVPAKLSDFRRTDIKAWIDISGTGIGPNGKIFPSKMDTQNISIKLPTDKEGLELLGTTPDKVTIQYYKKRHLLNKENQGDGDSKSVQGKKNNKGQDKSEGKKNENKGGQDKGKAKPSQKEPTRDKPTSNNGTSAKSSANESPQKGRRGDTVKAGQDKEGKRDRNKKKLPKNGGEQKPASKQGSN
jgi:hypothetical protein